MPITLNGTTGVVTPGATIGSINGILKSSSGVVSQAVAGTDYLAPGGAGTLTLGTAQTASGTAVDFTGIPSWAKRITVMLNNVSTNGSSNIIIQIGSTTFLTSGYSGGASTQAGAIVSNSIGFGIVVSTATPSDNNHGTAILGIFSGNTWSEYSNVVSTAQSRSWYGAGTASLSGTLDRLRITTVNGTDQFDAGTINISYE
jgi:hypothetical protein